MLIVWIGRLIKIVDGQANIHFARIEDALLFKIDLLTLTNDGQRENTVMHSQFFSFQRFKAKKNSTSTQCIMK